MNSPKISIIVPVYKAEQYLHKCLDSLLKQTFTDFEILLIDDGSPDYSGRICDEYAEKNSRIRVFHKKNGGVSSARNLGLDNIYGDWVTFVDSDDWVAESYLTDFGLDNSNIEFYLQGYKVIKDKKILRVHQFESRNLPGWTLEDLFIESEKKDIINSPVCKLFKSSILKKHKLYFDLNTSYGEDHLFSLKYMCNIKNICVVPSTSYFYIYHDNDSLTRRFVPYKQLVYYTMNASQLQYIFINQNKIECDNVKEVVNMRLYSNVIRTLKDFFSNPDCHYDDYYFIKNSFKSAILNYNGLRLYQKILFVFLRYLPCRISFSLFHILLSK